jgi:hypothetical protein
VSKTNNISAADIVSSLQGNFSSLAKLICSLEPKSCSNDYITIRGHYLPFQGSKPRLGELLEHISLYICNFALSRSEIDAVHDKVRTASEQEKLLAYIWLRDSAAELFIKAQKSTNRNGECGELLLYLLTEWILEAPQLLAKMSMKTTSSMPVHSSDGIHVKFDAQSNKLVFFWGEAKIHKTIGSALSDAVNSISTALEHSKLKEDIRLVRRFISTTGLPVNAQAKIVEYLDPLSDSYDQKLYASTCLIGFDFATFSKLATVNANEIESFFAKELEEELKKATKSLQSLLTTKNISHHRLEVFFLPVESVAQLRNDWQMKIGWLRAAVDLVDQTLHFQR